jgi:hypothetical protein
MKIPRWAVPIGAGVLVLLVGWMVVQRVYLAPRAIIARDIADTQRRIEALDKTLDATLDARERAKSLASSLLGATPDDVSARFRDGLARVAEQHGLTSVTVDTARPQDAPSPLLTARGVPSTLKRDLRREPDFAIVRGTITGTGTYEQVMAAVATLQSQAWITRVESVTLKPLGRQRETVQLSASVATLLAPALAAYGGVTSFEPRMDPTPEERSTLAMRIAEKNVFRRPNPAPAPPTRTADRPPAQPNPDPAPRAVAFAPYEDWHLRGVFEGSSGTEAILENRKTGARVILPVGGTVLDAVFVEGQGERAVFEIGGKRFEVSNGQTLAARRPLG